MKRSRMFKALGATIDLFWFCCWVHQVIAQDIVFTTSDCRCQRRSEFIYSQTESDPPEYFDSFIEQNPVLFATSRDPNNYIVIDGVTVLPTYDERCEERGWLTRIFFGRRAEELEKSRSDTTDSETSRTAQDTNARSLFFRRGRGRIRFFSSNGSTLDVDVEDLESGGVVQGSPGASASNNGGGINRTPRRGGFLSGLFQPDFNIADVGQAGVEPESEAEGVSSSSPPGNTRAFPCDGEGVPTVFPTMAPSFSPSLSQVPSGSPSTATPTTGRPTPAPTRSVSPTARMTLPPSTMSPSDHPSSSPSRRPSKVPSSTPSLRPSGVVSDAPSQQPTGPGFEAPSQQPTTIISESPSEGPSPGGQVGFDAPSQQPSGFGFDAPSQQPSGFGFEAPSQQPTGPDFQAPSQQPTGPGFQAPSQQPTGSGFQAPSQQPTAPGFEAPSQQPSGPGLEAPSQQPTGPGFEAPSQQPTGPGLEAPSQQPTGPGLEAPSQLPSSIPSILPSNLPTLAPSTSTNPSVAGA